MSKKVYGSDCMKEAADRRALVACSDSESCGAMARMLLEMDLDAVYAAEDAMKTLDLLRRGEADILLCDMVLSGADGLYVLRRLREMPLSVMPAAVMLVTKGMEPFALKAREAGACACLYRPVTPRMLKECLDSITPYDRMERAGADRRTIMDCLRSLGFLLKLSGTACLAESIYLASKDARLLRSLTGALYPMAADHLGVQSGRMEHAMRRAVESAWSGGAIRMQHAVFGNTIDARRGKPTSGELIARVVELLRVKELEYNEY